MAQYDDFDDDEEYVIIERRSGGVGVFLAGIAVGAALALLYAPQSGAETRAEIRRNARKVKRTAVDLAEGVQEKVSGAFEAAREEVENRLESARHAIEVKKQQVSRAVEAGREAAQQARADLERRIAESKGVTPGAATLARTDVRARRSAPSARPAGMAGEGGDGPVL